MTATPTAICTLCPVRDECLYQTRHGEGVATSSDDERKPLSMVHYCLTCRRATYNGADWDADATEVDPTCPRVHPRCGSALDCATCRKYREHLLSLDSDRSFGLTTFMRMLGYSAERIVDAARRRAPSPDAASLRDVSPTMIPPWTELTAEWLELVWLPTEHFHAAVKGLIDSGGTVDLREDQFHASIFWNNALLAFHRHERHRDADRLAREWLVLALDIRHLRRAWCDLGRSVQETAEGRLKAAVRELYKAEAPTAAFPRE